LLLQIACHSTDCRFYDVCGDFNDFTKWEWFSLASSVILAKAEIHPRALHCVILALAGAIAKAARQRQ
jgi:hypothetical protein